MAIKFTRKNNNASNERILVIDDDASLRMLLEIMLKQRYQVISVENGYEALFWLENNEIPDLIIADINMPRIDGLKFINHIKKSGYYRNIPVIVLSGYYDDEVKSRCLAAGVEDFMVKPFNPAALSDTINNLLTRSKKQSIKYA